ncbi:MAG TPA: hypothetical protein VE093_06320 [Polyangiaceae bacterium]|nr:hypothetical protein [Polyangiaceae bacterium]
MRRLRRLSMALAALAGLLLATSSASAFERQWRTGVSLGYAYFSNVGDENLHGLGGGLHLTYGLSDAWNASITADSSYHPSGDALIFGGAAGVSYIVDILQVVPHVGLLLGPYDVWRVGGVCGVSNAPPPPPSSPPSSLPSPPPPPCHRFSFGASIPFGLDYTVSRSFAVGVGGRYQLLIASDGVAQMITAFARAELTWGY